MCSSQAKPDTFVLARGMMKPLRKEGFNISRQRVRVLMKHFRVKGDSASGLQGHNANTAIVSQIIRLIKILTPYAPIKCGRVL